MLLNRDITCNGAQLRTVTWNTFMVQYCPNVERIVAYYKANNAKSQASFQCLHHPSVSMTSLLYSQWDDVCISTYLWDSRVTCSAWPYATVCGWWVQCKSHMLPHIVSQYVVLVVFPKRSDSCNVLVVSLLAMIYSTWASVSKGISRLPDQTDIVCKSSWGLASLPLWEQVCLT